MRDTRTASISFSATGTVPGPMTDRKWASMVFRISGRCAAVRNMFGMLPRSSRKVSKSDRMSAPTWSGRSRFNRPTAPPSFFRPIRVSDTPAQEVPEPGARRRGWREELHAQQVLVSFPRRLDPQNHGTQLQRLLVVRIDPKDQAPARSGLQDALDERPALAEVAGMAEKLAEDPAVRHGEDQRPAGVNPEANAEVGGQAGQERVRLDRGGEVFVAAGQAATEGGLRRAGRTDHQDRGRRVEGPLQAAADLVTGDVLQVVAEDGGDRSFAGRQVEDVPAAPARHQHIPGAGQVALAAKQ